MQTTQLVKASAEVVTITSFSPGDVYKRVESGYSRESTLRFGIVQDVMNNGEDAAVTALEYRSDYSTGITVEQKVWDGTKPAAIYAATPDEVRSHLAELRESAERKVKTAEESLATANRALALTEQIEQQVASGVLSAPAVVAGALAS